MKYMLLIYGDPSRWDAAKIESGLATLDRALRLRRPGPFQLQAAIAALHAEAPSFADTDWRRSRCCTSACGASIRRR